ncbi:MAG: hypothetical protein IJ104_02875 [Methanobrevibacter sp.]|nr:hypothetical protein [Methanobrevibacter sp.]
MKSHPQECTGCCNRKTCDHDLEKCCYLVRNRCLLQERNHPSFINCIK